MTPLIVEVTSTGLVVLGECDMTSARRLERALLRMEGRRERFDVDLSLVSFADSRGLAPLAESVRRCRQLRRPELRVRHPSSAVRRVLGGLGVAADPFGLRAWDATALLAALPTDTATPWAVAAVIRPALRFR